MQDHLPEDLIIMDEQGERLQGIIGPFDEGSSLTLSCEADGGNPALRWWRDAVVTGDRYFLTEQNFSRNELFLESLHRTDLLVNLTCSVLDYNITSPIASSVVIDMNYPPEAPKNCVVSNSTYRCVRVECDKGDDGGLEMSFQVELSDTSSDELLANLTDVNPEFSICSLPAETTFLLSLYAINSNGKSETIEILASTTSFLGRRSNEDDNTPLIFISVGALFILILFGLIIYYKRRPTKAGDDEDSNKSEDEVLSADPNAFTVSIPEPGIRKEEKNIQAECKDLNCEDCIQSRPVVPTIIISDVDSPVSPVFPVFQTKAKLLVLLTAMKNLAKLSSAILSNPTLNDF
ncbi:uncharacterized protein CDAR_45261 [Caerostris darwini]|uniref:Ig-like domain-containing protein n=1 Tax=Caerostris darwini TaxID=1538125 RepID=A0AAV4V754_9ARAC|nr:uncharacterized protein CDAR_45261 [Caerostris darwini]